MLELKFHHTLMLGIVLVAKAIIVHIQLLGRGRRYEGHLSDSSRAPFIWKNYTSGWQKVLNDPRSNLKDRLNYDKNYMLYMGNTNIIAL